MRVGLLFGLVCTAVAVIQVLLQGLEFLAEKNIAPAGILVVYLGGGALAGVVVGILLPLSKTRLGSAITGIAALLPASVVLRYAQQGFTPWTGTDIAVVCAMSVTLGALLGVNYHAIFWGGHSTRRPRE